MMTVVKLNWSRGIALIALLLVGCLSVAVHGFHSAAFASDGLTWVLDSDYEDLDGSSIAEFIVALKVRNVEEMKQEFLEVSSIHSPKYGSFHSLQSLQEKYGPLPQDKAAVVSYFRSIPGAIVADAPGDMLTVSAPIAGIEAKLQTKLAWYKHVNDAIVGADGNPRNRGLRASQSMIIPPAIQDRISFISLNMPIFFMKPSLSRAKLQRSEQTEKLASRNQAASISASAASSTVSIVQGNEEILVKFMATCGDGSLNAANPPCSNLDSAYVPEFKFTVTERQDNFTDPYTLTTNPLVFAVSAPEVYCYDTVFKGGCLGDDADKCVCIAKISEVPKYTQLVVNLTYTIPGSGTPDNIYQLGVSSMFALTDVATATSLTYLYNMPAGLTVQYGSNQSVVEFLGEFYSNADLATFLAYSGLPTASIPDVNVFGNATNDQSDPGGEAQLDVEYIMALAPGADTFFYSFSNTNPYSSNNEGFLAYLEFVNNQEYPPLVHSLSYGDVEAAVFNASNPGSSEYGARCDVEFMKMGLRGLTVVFSSGDDGIGNFIVRDYPDVACSQAYPSWPAASPYVTAVGATQLTNRYLPICEKNYDVGTAYPYVPESLQLQVQCTAIKETTCSSTLGGVITSGGGFSNVAVRATTAPWQEAAVNAYLADPLNIPPLSYFNSSGRGYPDIATYGSNYFIFLNDSIVRESGTSASAPVFASMVTLWNDMRLAYGKSSMGFIAPFLYEVYAAHPEAFHDVTTGDNACGAGHSIDDVNCCEYSFKAAPGWDAVTGLGTPNFQVLANLVLNPTTPFPSVSASAGLSTSTTITDDDDDDDDTKTAATVAIVLGVYSTLLSTLLAGVVLYFLFFAKSATGGTGLRATLLDQSSHHNK